MGLFISLPGELFAPWTPGPPLLHSIPQLRPAADAAIGAPHLQMAGLFRFSTPRGTILAIFMTDQVKKDAAGHDYAVFRDRFRVITNHRQPSNSSSENSEDRSS